MKGSELRWVTDHLGHTVDVHKKWYRLSNRAVELTKVASILSATESGHLQNAHNVHFDDVSKETVGNDRSSPEPPYSNDDTQASFVAAQYVEDYGEQETPEENPHRKVHSPMKSQTSPPVALTARMLSGKDVCEPETSKQNPHTQILSRGKGKKKQVHVAWSIDEKKAIYSAFSNYLSGTERQLPGKREICTAQTKFQILQKRSWLNIKFQLKNMLTKSR